MDNCIVCKIIKGELPSSKVYEDDNYLVFMALYPVAEGHVLVVPKKHYRWVWDVKEVGEYFKVVRKIANILKKTYDTDLVLSYVHGTDLPHAHVWLIPADKDNADGYFKTNLLDPGREALDKEATKIRNTIDG